MYDDSPNACKRLPEPPKYPKSSSERTPVLDEWMNRTNNKQTQTNKQNHLSG